MNLITMKNHARMAMEVWRLRARFNPVQVEALFENAPDGDFRWDSDEAGDWHVYCCGKRDCPVQWHKVSYALNAGRKDGKRFIEQLSVDEDGDGNWDHEWYWEDGEDFQEFGESLRMEHPNYLKGWFDYWVEAAETGEDPLGEATGKTRGSYARDAGVILNYLNSNLFRNPTSEVFCKEAVLKMAELAGRVKHVPFQWVEVNGHVVARWKHEVIHWKFEEIWEVVNAYPKLKQKQVLRAMRSSYEMG